MKPVTPAILLVMLLAGCADHGPPLAISGLAVTPPVPGRGTSAAYFTLVNSGPETITITRVASRQYGKVEMHETIFENDVARMRRLDSVSIEPGGQVAFERGGRHVMLMNPIGDVSRVTLDFYADADLLLSVSTAVGETD